MHKKYRVYASGCSLASTFDCKNHCGSGEKHLGRNDICTFVHSLFESGLIKFNESSREFSKEASSTSVGSHFLVPSNSVDRVEPRRGPLPGSSVRSKPTGPGMKPTADLEHQAALTHLERGAQELPDSDGNSVKDSVGNLVRSSADTGDQS